MAPRSTEARIAWFLANDPSGVGMCAQHSWRSLGGDYGDPAAWGAANANEVYDLVVASGRYFTSEPPRGALVLWKYGVNGHAEISVGGGQVVTTDPPGNSGGTGYQPLDHALDWGAVLSRRIWTDEYNGVRFDVAGVTGPVPSLPEAPSLAPIEGSGPGGDGSSEATGYSGGSGFLATPESGPVHNDIVIPSPYTSGVVNCSLTITIVVGAEAYTGTGGSADGASRSDFSLYFFPLTPEDIYSSSYTEGILLGTVLPQGGTFATGQEYTFNFSLDFSQVTGPYEGGLYYAHFGTSLGIGLMYVEDPFTLSATLNYEIQAGLPSYDFTGIGDLGSFPGYNTRTVPLPPATVPGIPDGTEYQIELVDPDGNVVAIGYLPPGADPNAPFTFRIDGRFITILYGGLVLITYLIPQSVWDSLNLSLFWVGYIDPETGLQLPDGDGVRGYPPDAGYQYILDTSFEEIVYPTPLSRVKNLYSEAIWEDGNGIQASRLPLDGVYQSAMWGLNNGHTARIPYDLAVRVWEAGLSRFLKALPNEVDREPLTWGASMDEWSTSDYDWLGNGLTTIKS